MPLKRLVHYLFTTFVHLTHFITDLTCRTKVNLYLRYKMSAKELYLLRFK